jgi:hypothetical protein
MVKIVCENGHTFYKSSDCLFCLKCEVEKESKQNFLSLVGVPARKTLNNKATL